MQTLGTVFIMSTKERYIDIIGAGLAGSTAAYYASKAGFQVRVFEKDEQVSHKVCGEFLSAEAQQCLNSMGINLDHYNAAKINHFNLFAYNKKITISLENECRGLSRKSLDQIIIDKAKENGSEIIFGHNIKELDFSEHKKIIATGKHDNPFHKRKGDTSLIGFKMHYQLTKESSKRLKDQINIFLYEGGYAGLCFVENDIASLCFLLNKKIYKQNCKSYEDTLVYMKQQNSDLAFFLEGTKALWSKELSISNIPYGFVEQRYFKDQVIGDQFAVVPSLMGTGMAIALLTARACIEGKNSSVQKKIKKKVKLAFLIHNLLMSKLTSKFLFHLALIFPFLIKFIFKQTRIK